MQSLTIPPEQSLSLFVKNILVFEEERESLQTVLPFYADGYPGLLFQQTTSGLLVNPHQKLMPKLFLYGQTLHPIELVLNGPYRLVVYQLYPFVLRSFFEVNPQQINDGCHDLDSLYPQLVQKLQQSESIESRIEIINGLLLDLFLVKQKNLDYAVSRAIQSIILNKGQLSIEALSQNINTTQRTLERRFLKEVGLSPKQFSTIIRFQQSLEQLELQEHEKVTDIVYAHGFADQSHFTRVFKAYTGSTPKKFSTKKG